MSKKITFWVVCFLWMAFSPAAQGFTQEDNISQIAIETIKTQMRLPRDIEIKFLEKRESAIPDFFAVRLLLSAPDRDIPLVVYVDKTAEKVIIGNLFVKGTNVTRKEAGEPKLREIDMGQLEMEKSPFRGFAAAKVTIVEFSNFQCPYCLRSWIKMKEFLEKHPQGIKYVFKHFPLESQKQSFDFSVMVAAVQEVSNEAFWLIHDFMFSNEGQALANGDKGVVKQKIEEMLKEKGYDVKAFQNALEKGKGQRRVEEDMAIGRKIRVTGTPTTILNGHYIVGSLADKVLEGFIVK
jgi:protein-disulfide isomerase